MTQLPPPTMRRLAIVGFRDAVERVKMVPAAVPTHLHIPLSEALLWAKIVDESLEKDDKVPEYRERRNQDKRGKLLIAMAHPRNAAAHHLTFTAEARGGLTFPATFPLSFNTHAIWAPILSEKWDVNNRRNQRRYEQDLLGKPVAETLTQVDDWFKLFESPQN